MTQPPVHHPAAAKPGLAHHDDHDDDQPKHTHPNRNMELLLFRLTALLLMLMILVAQFVQISYLRNLPTGSTNTAYSDRSAPMPVQIVNQNLRVEVDNPLGQLGAHPLLVELSPYAAPIKVENVGQH